MIEKLLKDIPVSRFMSIFRDKINELVDEVNSHKKNYDSYMDGNDVAILDAHRRITAIDGVSGSIEKLQKRIAALELSEQFRPMREKYCGGHENKTLSHNLDKIRRIIDEIGMNGFGV